MTEFWSRGATKGGGRRAPSGAQHCVNMGRVWGRDRDTDRFRGRDRGMDIGRGRARDRRRDRGRSKDSGRDRDK